MTKTEFIDQLASRHKWPRMHAEKVLNATLAALEDGLFNDGRIAIPGFGVFDILEKPARNGRNPATGEALQIPASRIPRFKPGKHLKEILN